MDGFEFAASLIGSLAWPITALIVVWLLRDSLVGALSGEVKRLKAGTTGFEIEYWEKKSKSVREALEAPVLYGAAIPLPESRQIPEGEFRRLAEMASVAPSGTVLEAYAKIESELARMVEDAGESADRTGGLRLAQKAYRLELIDESSLSAIQGLTELRNQAAHGRSSEGITAGRALDFLLLAEQVLDAIRADGGDRNPQRVPPTPHPIDDSK